MRIRRSIFALGVVVFLAGWCGLVLPMLPNDDSAAAAQTELRKQYKNHFPAMEPTDDDEGPGVARDVPVGQPVAEMRIPALGADWRWIALEGTSEEVLAAGPGHYAWSPSPGARGNVAFAAHRSGHGDPFLDFDRLRPGDLVIFRQGHQGWVYALTTRPRIIDASASWVLDALPGHRLTLTTCWPKYGSSQRMYVRGRLLSRLPAV